MRRQLHSEHGFTLVEILIVVSIVGVLAAMAAVRLSQAKMASNEASAIASLRVINSAEMTFSSSCGGDGYAQSLEALSMPPAATAQSFISADLTTTGVQKSGYFFTLQADTGAQPVLLAARTCNTVADSVSAYFAFANPVAYENSGRRTFATDKSATIFQRFDGIPITSGMAGASPIE